MLFLPFEIAVLDLVRATTTNVPLANETCSFKVPTNSKESPSTNYTVVHKTWQSIFVYNLANLNRLLRFFESFLIKIIEKLHKFVKVV